MKESRRQDRFADPNLARLGALSADAEPAVVETLTTWAWELGMVFQLVDDALDLSGPKTALANGRLDIGRENSRCPCGGGAG